MIYGYQEHIIADLKELRNSDVDLGPYSIKDYFGLNLTVLKGESIIFAERVDNASTFVSEDAIVFMKKYLYSPPFDQGIYMQRFGNSKRKARGFRVKLKFSDGVRTYGLNSYGQWFPLVGFNLVPWEDIANRLREV